MSFLSFFYLHDSNNEKVTLTYPETKKPVGFAIFLKLVAIVGLIAAFALTVEKIHQLQFPDESASCDLSVLVQCGKNLQSWQGSLLGFPNALLGLIGWPVVLATAAGLWAGARYANWYWRAFNIVAAGAFILVLWLFSQSVFVLGTLCPWCMVTWLATIPLFWVTTFWTMKHGVWGQSVTRIGSVLLSWSGIFILVTVLAEALIAQVVLNWISTL